MLVATPHRRTSTRHCSIRKIKSERALLKLQPIITKQKGFAFIGGFGHAPTERGRSTMADQDIMPLVIARSVWLITRNRTPLPRFRSVKTMNALLNLIATTHPDSL